MRAVFCFLGETVVAPLLDLPDELPLADLLDALVLAGEALCGEALWAREDGRSLAQFVQNLRANAREVNFTLARKEASVASSRRAPSRVFMRDLPPRSTSPLALAG